MQLFLGSDHGGFALKEELVGWLTAAGRGQRDFRIEEVVDLGPDHFDPEDDYPFIAAKVARAVQARPGSRGILICRSGQGVALVANKFSSIRAAVAWNEQVAAASRTDDDANVLCLPADYLQSDEAVAISREWLSDELAPDERYQRRLDEISAIEAELQGQG